MSKYVDRIIEEIDFNFERHFHDNEDKHDFLSELVKAITDRLENLNDTMKFMNDGECGVCPESECDCEPESCL